jgi:xylulokinase
VRAEKIIAVGGATRNEFWMQNKANIVGKPIEAPEVGEAVPLGAAILAGIGVGLYRDEQDAFERVCKPGRTWEPNAEETEAYAERFTQFEKLYPALKDFHAELGDAR